MQFHFSVTNKMLVDGGYPAEDNNLQSVPWLLSPTSCISIGETEEEVKASCKSPELGSAPLYVCKAEVSNINMISIMRDWLTNYESGPGIEVIIVDKVRIRL